MRPGVYEILEGPRGTFQYFFGRLSASFFEYNFSMGSGCVTAPGIKVAAVCASSPTRRDEPVMRADMEKRNTPDPLSSLIICPPPMTLPGSPPS